MKMVMVSAIIPTYNEEKCIAECLDSLLNQTMNDLEIIVVDDGSTDKTLEIEKKYEKKYEKIKVLTQEHKGAAEAWNKGLKISRGKVILIVGADMVLGRDYVKDTCSPILEKKAICTMYKEAKVANINNLWARARSKVIKGSEIAFIGIDKKELLEIGGFDPSIGYADDEVLYRKKGIRPLLVNTEIKHYNPDTFKEVWKQSLWIGSSMKSRYIMAFMLPFAPILGIIKSIKHFFEDPYIIFIIFLPIYHTIKYVGYWVGAWKRILFKKNIR